MNVLILEIAERELNKFDVTTKKIFQGYFNLIEEGEVLDKSKFKKLSGSSLWEFRVKYNTNIYRGISGYLEEDLVVVLFFQKKSQKIPLNLLKVSEQRFKELKKIYDKKKV